MSSLPLRRIGQGLLFTLATATGILALTPVSETPLTPGDTTFFQQFGWAVAADGDTVVVGAPADCPQGLYNAGAVYVFVRDGNGWTQQAKLVAADAADFSQFGYAVSIRADTILVGAHYDGAYAGAAYLFTRVGETWTEQAKLTPADAVPGKEFGCAVALDGHRLVVGAMADAEGGFNAGAAYVFEWMGTQWHQHAKLMSAPPQPGDLFGFAVALAGDTLVVGSPFDDDGGVDTGAVHVFTHTESGWGQQAELFASDAAMNAVFGWSVAITGDRVLAGAPQQSGTAEFAGAAYLFSRVGSAWTQESKLLAADARANDRFGYAVALRGAMAAIGAPLDSSNGDFAGATHLFRYAGDVWNQDGELPAANVQPGDQFGFCVALTDSLLVIGAPYNDQTVWFDNGAAFAFVLPSPNHPPVADASATVTEVISENRVDAAVTLDGSRSSDADNDALTFTWSAGDVQVAAGSPASVVLAVGAHELTLTVSDGSLTSTATVLVTVAVPANTPPVADASATIREVISPNNRNAEVLLDGSRSTDAEGDVLAFEWSREGSVIGTAQSARVVLPVGWHEVILSVHDAQASDQDAVTVRIITPAAATRALRQMVEEANVPAARERLLLTILQVAEHSFQGGHMNAAVHQLMVFQKVVQAREGRRVESATAVHLVQAAQRIIDAIPRR